MKISETCSCGAKIDIDSASANDTQTLLDAVKKWRDKHQHVIPVYRGYTGWPYVTYGSGGAINVGGGSYTTTFGTDTIGNYTKPDEDPPAALAAVQ